MSKNNLICLIIIAILMASTALFTTNYVIKEKNNHSFHIRTLTHMSELDDITYNQLERLKFTKAVFIFASIQQLKEKITITQHKDWCDYVYEDYDEKIITLIEDRIEIPKNDLDKFLIGYKKLENICLSE